MFREVDKLEDMSFSELETWFKLQGGRIAVRVRGQLWGFIMYNPFLRCITFVKPCLPRHFYYKYQGFGISESIFPRLRDKKVQYIFIRYKGKQVSWYLADAEVYYNGIPEHDPRDPSDLQRIVSTKLTVTKRLGAWSRGE